jgi:hypothetical protein
MADHDPITAIRGQRAYGGLAFCDSQIDTLLSRIDELTAERDAAAAKLSSIAAKMREAIETETPKGEE